MTSPADKPNEDPDRDPEEIVEAAQARRADSLPPEVDSVTKELTEWDEPPAASGKAAPKVLPEDEVAATEQLIREGLDEADREQRIAAADPDSEP